MNNMEDAGNKTIKDTRSADGGQRTVRAGEEAGNRTIRISSDDAPATDGGQRTVRAGEEAGNGMSMDELFDMMKDHFLFDSFGKKPKPANLRIRYKLTLEQVATGAHCTVRYKRQEACERCQGEGSTQLTSLPCSECGGKGYVWDDGEQPIANGIFGNVRVAAPYKRTCPQCHGRGTVGVCPDCGGSGCKQGVHAVTFDVPPGVSEETPLIIRGGGNYVAETGRYGNLLVFFEVEEHHIFRREGANLVYTMYVDDSVLLNGGFISVRTLEGPVRVQINPNSSRKVALEGYGLPYHDMSGRGDLIVIFTEYMPEKTQIM